MAHPTGNVWVVTVLRLGKEMVELDEPRMRELYDELWRVAVEERGAVTAAARLRHAIAYAGARSRLIAFEDQEATVVRAALGRIDGP